MPTATTFHTATVSMKPGELYIIRPEPRVVFNDPTNVVVLAERNGEKWIYQAVRPGRVTLVETWPQCSRLGCPDIPSGTEHVITVTR